MKRVIFMHGKDKTAQDVWYPWLAQQLAENGVRCDAPDLPHADAPKIVEWLGVLDALKPDADTILVGHSRGGMAILRWLESRKQKVAKVVLVATNSATMEDSTHGDFYSGPYDFATIRKCCDDFVLLHSKDDPWVRYAAALENAEGLHGNLISFENRFHFGKQPDGTLQTTFPELLEVILPAPAVI